MNFIFNYQAAGDGRPLAVWTKLTFVAFAFLNFVRTGPGKTQCKMIVDTNLEPISKNPVYSEIAEEVGTLVHYAPIVKEWRRQVYIALIRSLPRTGWHKMHGLIDLPYAYLDLAALHDYFDPLKPIITSELQKLQKKSFRSGVSPLFCKNCLREIRNDLIQKDLIPGTGVAANLSEAKRIKPEVFLPPDSEKLKKSGISRKEANIKAREILEKEPSIKARDLAEKIPCSIGLVSKLPVWKAVQKLRKKGRKAKKVRLTDKMLSVTGSGEKDQIFKQLVIDQQADMQEDNRQAKLFLSKEKKPHDHD